MFVLTSAFLDFILPVSCRNWNIRWKCSLDAGRKLGSPNSTSASVIGQARFLDIGLMNFVTALNLEAPIKGEGYVAEIFCSVEGTAGPYNKHITNNLITN